MCEPCRLQDREQSHSKINPTSEHEKIVERLYTLSLPIAERAHSDLRCSASILALAGSMDAPVEVVRSHLTHIMNLSNVEWVSLMNCKIMLAFSCALHVAKSRPCLLTPVLITMRTAIAGKVGWIPSAIESGLHILITEKVLDPTLGEHDVDTAFTILEAFTKNQGAANLSMHHYTGLSRAVMGHCSCRRPFVSLLSHMLSLNRCCRYMYRDPTRSATVLKRVLACFTAGSAGNNEERYTSAASCLVKACDNDMVRFTESFNVHQIEFLLDSINRQMKSGLAVEMNNAVRVIRSLFGKKTTCFVGHGKNSKLPSLYETLPYFTAWVKVAGDECLISTAKVMSNNDSTVDHHTFRSCVIVADTVAQYMNPSREAATEVATVMCDRLSTNQGYDLIDVRSVMETVVHLALAAGAVPASLDPRFANVLRNVEIQNTKFRMVCRGNRLYTVPDSSEGRECSICYEDIKDNACTTCCGHTFHQQCITRWFGVNIVKTCPICRSPGTNTALALMGTHEDA
jgi:Ring finger domain